MTLALPASPASAGSSVAAPPLRMRTGRSLSAPIAGALQPATRHTATRMLRSAAKPRRRGPRPSVRDQWLRSSESAPPVGRQAKPIGVRRSGHGSLDRDGLTRACRPHVTLPGESGQERDDAYPAPHAPEYTGGSSPEPEGPRTQRLEPAAGLRSASRRSCQISAGVMKGEGRGAGMSQISAWLLCGR